MHSWIGANCFLSYVKLSLATRKFLKNGKLSAFIQSLLTSPIEGKELRWGNSGQGENNNEVQD
jgi:hypothetical protein